MTYAKSGLGVSQSLSQREKNKLPLAQVALLSRPPRKKKVSSLLNVHSDNGDIAHSIAAGALI